MEVATMEDEFQLKLLNYINLDLRKQLALKGANSPGEWRIFLFILNKLMQYPNPQPQHVDDNEAHWMAYYSSRGWTYEDLAFAFDRSKATVHVVLKKFELEDNRIGT